VKTILILKQIFTEVFKVFFIIFNLMNCTMIYDRNFTSQNIEDNSSLTVIDQSFNYLPESISLKVHFKIFTETFAEKFYSYDYSLKSPYIHSKIFVIVAQSISELNSRNSSFLIAELTTST